MSIFQNINRYAIGFDHLMDHMIALQNNDVFNGSEYPPYDIVRAGENEYTIELAIAGFKKDELKVILKDNSLTISGDSSKRHSNEEYLHKNIARRSFKRRFTLADNIQVTDAKFEDGVLEINLLHDIPEDQKPKQIDIN